MNPAITAALAAAQHSATFDPVAKLTAAGANSSDKAIALDPEGAAGEALIETALAQGLIQRTADGRFYVNERAVEERNATLGGQVLIVVLIGLSIAASVIALLALR